MFLSLDGKLYYSWDSRFYMFVFFCFFALFFLDLLETQGVFSFKAFLIRTEKENSAKQLQTNAPLSKS